MKDDILKLIYEISVSDQVRRFYREAFIDVGCQYGGQKNLEESSDTDDKAY